MTPKEFARDLYARMKPRIKAGSTVPLVEYQTEAEAAAIDPDTSWFEQRERNTEIAKLLVADGHTPVVVQLFREPYLKWLKKYGKENTSAIRAEYAAWVVAGGPGTFNSIGGEEEL